MTRSHFLGLGLGLMASTLAFGCASAPDRDEASSSDEAAITSGTSFVFHWTGQVTCTLDEDTLTTAAAKRYVKAWGLDYETLASVLGSAVTFTCENETIGDVTVTGPSGDTLYQADAYASVQLERVGGGEGGDLVGARYSAGVSTRGQTLISLFKDGSTGVYGAHVSFDGPYASGPKPNLGFYTSQPLSGELASIREFREFMTCEGKIVTVENVYEHLRGAPRAPNSDGQP